MYEVKNGDSRDLLLTLEDGTVDAIVTDPPYEIGFLGKGWDSSGVAYDVEFWKQCLRVLKPGGHLIAFSSPRTYHRMACAIEDAGFEIRDQLMWLYGEGLPKGQNLELAAKKKNLQDDIVASVHGWNTTLKSCHEPMVLARKAVEGTVLDNMATYGVGGLHVDVCRISVDWDKDPSSRGLNSGFVKEGWTQDDGRVFNRSGARTPYDQTKGRWPANVVHDGSPDVVSCFPESGPPCGSAKKSVTEHSNIFGKVAPVGSNSEFVGDTGNASRFFYKADPDVLSDRYPTNVMHDGSPEVLCHFPETQSGVLKKGSTKAKDYKVGDVNRARKGGRPPLLKDTIGDRGSAARFFYCAKAKKKDRDAGLDSFEAKETWAMQNAFTSDPRMDKPQQRLPKKNTHVTVKPTKLMQWLVRLVVPQGALVLDPFTGSGSTGRGCMLENIRFLGFELSEEYCSIATARIEDAMLEYQRSQENHEAPSLFGADTEDEDDEV